MLPCDTLHTSGCVHIACPASCLLHCLFNLSCSSQPFCITKSSRHAGSSLHSLTLVYACSTCCWQELLCAAIGASAHIDTDFG